MVEVPYVDTAPSFKDEEIHFGEYMIHVRWNPYLRVMKLIYLKLNQLVPGNLILIGTGAGKSKDLAVEDAKRLI